MARPRTFISSTTLFNICPGVAGLMNRGSLNVVRVKLKLGN